MTKIKRHKKLFFSLMAAGIMAAAVGTILFIILRPSAGRETAVHKNNVITLGRRDLTKSISATGTIKSAASKTVTAKAVNLTVKNVKVQVGESVKKGDTLLTFDKSDLTDALTDAKENLAAAQSDSDRSISSAAQQLSNARETSSAETAKSAKAVSRAKKSLSDAKKQVETIKKQIKASTNAARKKELQEQLIKAQETKSQAQTSYY